MDLNWNFDGYDRIGCFALQVSIGLDNAMIRNKKSLYLELEDTYTDVW